LKAYIVHDLSLKEAGVFLLEFDKNQEKDHEDVI